VKPIEAVDERKAGTLKMLSGKRPSVTGSITVPDELAELCLACEIRENMPAP
jgi:hypothetical protein